MTDEIDKAFEEWFNSKSDGEQVNFLFCGNKAKECFRAGAELIERKYKGKLYSERCHSMHDMKEETRLKEYWKEQDEEWQKKVEELRDVIEEFHGRTDMGLWNEVKVEINRIFGKEKGVLKNEKM